VPRLLDTEFPIIQAPMAGVQGSVLAAAVCNAGGLGSLPCALLGASGLREELRALRAATDRPFNVNFFCHIPPQPDSGREARWRAALAPYYQELGLDVTAIPTGPGREPFGAEALEILEEARPAVVSFHFGLPARRLLDAVRAIGSTIVASATTVAEAQWLEARGADAVIAQGVEAGGHRGMFLTEDLTSQVGTLPLVRQVVGAVGVPVIAAGGIADARGVTAALAMGAAAVQVGTAYLLCDEAVTSQVHRAALTGPAARHTALTNVFTGRPARSIVNRAIRELGPISAAAPDFPLAATAITPLRAEAERRGSGDFSPLWSGQDVTGCAEIPAAEQTRRLAAGL